MMATNNKKYEAVVVVQGLAYPHGIVKAKDGSFFVADQNNNQVKKLIPQQNGAFKSELFAGSTVGYHDGARTEALFNFIGSLVLDEEENLYICDTDNSCVRRVSSVTNKVDTFVPTKLQTNDHREIVLHKNRAMTIDRKKEHIYFSDSSGTLFKINLHSGRCEKTFNIEKPEHNLPRGLVFDNEDNLYYTTDMAVKKMDMKTSTPQLICKVDAPRSLTIDPSNRFLYVGTNNTVARINLKDNQLKPLVDMEWATGLVLDGKGNLFVSHYTAGSIKKIALLKMLDWKCTRVIWIGNMKNRPQQCPIARLPKEIVKELLSFCIDY